MSKIISAINTILLIAQAVIAVTIIKSCDTIPVHWNITGEIDSYGSPCSIIFLPILAAASWGLIIFAIRHPQYINLPPSVKNKSLAIAISRQLLSMCSLWIMAMTTYICICVTVNTSMVWGLVLFIASLIAIIIYYGIMLYRT
ncbi:MAG: DUF1648 domain-containing protein [Duncaniella sp.]|nr:DUF1648 domain-containing protein [Duncaniella sp.]